MAEEFEDERDEARAEVERLREALKEARSRLDEWGKVGGGVKGGEAILAAQEIIDRALALPAEPPEDARAITDEEWNICPCGCDVRMDDPSYAELHGDNSAPAPEAEPRPDEARCDTCGELLSEPAPLVKDFDNARKLYCPNMAHGTAQPPLADEVGQARVTVELTRAELEALATAIMWDGGSIDREVWATAQTKLRAPLTRDSEGER
jgi:hypothetical protein